MNSRCAPFQVNSKKTVYPEGSIFENTIYPSIGTFRRKADLYR